jgi:Ca2+-binding EF-hand superfamily protein
MQNIDQNLLKLSWQLFDKNGTGSITSEEVGMFFLNFCHFTPQGVVIFS